MKYATPNIQQKKCIHKCVHILSIELKVLKLKEGICNMRLIQELEYAWWDKIMLRGLDLKYRILERKTFTEDEFELITCN